MDEKTDTGGSLELEKTESEKKDEELTPLEYDISIYPADYTLEGLYIKWKNGDIIIPKFQRSYVWTLAQASRLIESFVMGLPIPPVFFYVQPDQKYLVIDGLQRLRTVFYYIEGFFGEPDSSGKRRVFKLDGINPASRLYKKSFQELDGSDQRMLKNAVLRAILVKQVYPSDDDTSIYHIFERLNTGGTSLRDQEVRNCVYAGRLNDLLGELNEYTSWRSILGKKKPDIRQKDVQLILRCIALFHDGLHYQKPMKDFLSRFMSRNRNPSEEFLLRERERFKGACDAVIRYLGERPFNPKGPLNPSLLDAVFVAFLKNYKSCPSDIADRYSRLKENIEFQKLVSDATTDPDVVHGRLEIAERTLFE